MHRSRCVNNEIYRGQRNPCGESLQENKFELCELWDLMWSELMMMMMMMVRNTEIIVEYR